MELYSGIETCNIGFWTLIRLLKIGISFAFHDSPQTIVQQCQIAVYLRPTDTAFLADETIIEVFMHQWHCDIRWVACCLILLTSSILAVDIFKFQSQKICSRASTCLPINWSSIFRRKFLKWDCGAIFSSIIIKLTLLDRSWCVDAKKVHKRGNRWFESEVIWKTVEGNFFFWFFRVFEILRSLSK